MVDEHEIVSQLTSYLRLTILIDRKPSFQFNIECMEKLTCEDLLHELQNYYYQNMKVGGIFEDRQCTRKVSLKQEVTNQQQYFYSFDFKEYEKQLKKVFRCEKNVKSPIKLIQDESHMVNQQISGEALQTESKIDTQQKPFIMSQPVFKDQAPQVTTSSKENLATSHNDNRLNQSPPVEVHNTSEFSLKVHPVQVQMNKNPSVGVSQITANTIDRFPVDNGFHCCVII